MRKYYYYIILYIYLKIYTILHSVTLNHAMKVLDQFLTACVDIRVKPTHYYTY